MKPTDLKINYIYQKEPELNPFAKPSYACILDIKPDKLGNLWVKYCDAIPDNSSIYFKCTPIPYTIQASYFIECYPIYVNHQEYKEKYEYNR